MWKAFREKFMSWWIGRNQYALVEAEIELLQETGIQPEYIEASDIWIDFSSYNFIDSSDPNEMYMHHVHIRQKEFETSWNQTYSIK